MVCELFELPGYELTVSSDDAKRAAWESYYHDYPDGTLPTNARVFELQDADELLVSMLDLDDPIAIYKIAVWKGKPIAVELRAFEYLLWDLLPA
jgi:hypothetical protein